MAMTNGMDKAMQNVWIRILMILGLGLILIVAMDLFPYSG